MLIVDVYVGTGDTSENDLIIQLDTGDRITVNWSAYLEICKAQQKKERVELAAKELARRKILESDPKVPCQGLLGSCGKPKPQSAGYCDHCNAEFNSDPDAYK